MFWTRLHQFDQQVTLAINSWSTPVTDPLWQFFSNIPVWIPMYVLIVALLVQRLGWKKGLIIVLAAAAAFGFCDQFSNIIKDLVGRVRPLNDEFMKANGLVVLEKGSRSFSFFSAHAANAFGLAACTSIGLKMDRRWFPAGGSPVSWGKAYIWWMFIWASLVAVSRVFVGKHYLGDVVAGALIGIIAGAFFALLAKAIIRRFIKN